MSASGFQVRTARPGDAASLLEIYRPHIEQSTTSFEYDVPSVEEFRRRITKSLEGWAWLVATDGDECVGYAYGSEHRARAAYQWSVETSVYIHSDYRRRGIAARLYEDLFEVLAGKGFCNAFAGVTLPNEASVAFHRRMGFEPIGTFKAVGRKFGSWHDVAWLQRPLRAEPPKD